MFSAFKRLASVILTASMVLSFLPAQAFAVPAEEETEPAEVQQTDAVPASELSTASVVFGTLQGAVTDSSGNGVPGVSVLLYNRDENTPLSLCRTNDAGIWTSESYEVLVGYTYVVCYYKTGYTFSSNHVE